MALLKQAQVEANIAHTIFQHVDAQTKTML